MKKLRDEKMHTKSLAQNLAHSGATSLYNIKEVINDLRISSCRMEIGKYQGSNQTWIHIGILHQPFISV